MLRKGCGCKWNVSKHRHPPQPSCVPFATCQRHVLRLHRSDSLQSKHSAHPHACPFCQIGLCFFPKPLGQAISSRTEGASTAQGLRPEAPTRQPPNTCTPLSFVSSGSLFLPSLSLFGRTAATTTTCITCFSPECGRSVGLWMTSWQHAGATCDYWSLETGGDLWSLLERARRVGCQQARASPCRLNVDRMCVYVCPGDVV